MREEPTFTLADCQAEYLCGLSQGKKMMGQGMLPNTVQITIRVLDDKENIEAITNIVTFEDIKQSKGDALQYEIEKTLVEIIKQGTLEKLLSLPSNN